ncbi:MAG: hypothetical protein M1281_01465 [Chloroflexi bacterium]|nr:hypothetical protein [Chloroflexota bacterium]
MAQGAIIARNARLGAWVVVQPFPHRTGLDTDLCLVREGIPVAAYTGPELLHQPALFPAVVKASPLPAARV